jgi:hypothetical protein
VAFDLSIHGLVTAIASAGRLDLNQMGSIGALVKSYELVSRSKTLLAIPEEASRSDEGVMRYLLTHRDKIAVESLKAQGELRSSEFIFEGAERYFRLGSLFNALFAARIIDDAMRTRLTSAVSGPMEYFLDNMELVESELKWLGRDGVRGKDARLERFEHSRKPGEALSHQYVGQILRWGEWFLNDPDVATRSIYRADEIAFMVLAGAGSVFEDAPADILMRIEDAGWDSTTIPATARKQSVSALYDLLDYYEDRELEGRPIREETRAALEKVDKLYMWNRDAVRRGRKRITRSGSGSPSAPTTHGGHDDSGLPGAIAMQASRKDPYMSMGMGVKVMLGVQAAHAATV